MLDKIELKNKILTKNFIFKTEDDVPMSKL